MNWPVFAPSRSPMTNMSLHGTYRAPPDDKQLKPGGLSDPHPAHTHPLHAQTFAPPPHPVSFNPGPPTQMVSSQPILPPPPNVAAPAPGPTTVPPPPNAMPLHAHAPHAPPPNAAGPGAGGPPQAAPTGPVPGTAGTTMSRKRGYADHELGQQQGGAAPSSDTPGKKRGRTNTPWTPEEEHRLKQMRDAGNTWSEIAKTFPTRTEGSVKKHWYKDMHYAEFTDEEKNALRDAIKEYDTNKWKVIGQKIGKPAKACEQYAKEHFKN